MTLPAGHVHRFPLRSALLASPESRDGWRPRPGVVARDGSYLSAKPGTDAEAEALPDAGAASAMRLLAGLRLPGLTWLQGTRADGTGYGQPCGRDGDGAVWIRHVEIATDGSLSCPPVALRLPAEAAPASPDPVDTEAAWLGWAKRDLTVEVLDPALDAISDAHVVGRAEVRCLLAVALAMAGDLPRSA